MKGERMSKTINIGIIGAGRIGRVHAETLAAMAPDVGIGMVVDANRKSAAAVARSCGAARVSNDPDEAIRDGEIDAVIVASPTDTHAGMIVAAAQAGKHVFCEKPIALELTDIDRALAAVERSGVIFMTGFNRRYDAGNRRLRQSVLEGKIGRPEMCVITSRDPVPPPVDYIRVSGGLFLDMAIHDFDLARHLLGDEPVEIFAYADCLVDPEIARAGDVDTAMTVIRFAGGALCHINNSRRAVYGYDQRVEVFGSKGMAATDNLPLDNLTLAGPYGFAEPPLMDFFMTRYLPAYREEAVDFIRCLREGIKPSASGTDGRAAVVMALAAGKSLREKRPVRIDEIVS